MIVIHNDAQQVGTLTAELVRFYEKGFLPVFDLDGVLFDARHRQSLNADGSLNLEAYRQNSTLENIAKDKPLPLLGAVHALNAANVPYLVCTARPLCEGTKKLLRDHGIAPIMAHGRGEDDHRRDFELKSQALAAYGPVLLVDDNDQNLEAIKGLGGYGIKIPFAGH